MTSRFRRSSPLDAARPRHLMPHPAAAPRVVDTARALVMALAARHPLDARALGHLRELRAPATRAAFLDVADDLHVRGLVLARLVRDGLLEVLPADASAPLVAALREMRRRSATQDMERDRVLALLHRAGIPVVLLKGAALRLTAYADAVERHTGDIDLLVAPAHVDAAVAVMTGSGYADREEGDHATYARHHFHHGLRHASGTVVELHWALTEPDAPGALDTAAFIARARPLERRQAAPVLVPKREDMLLHLAAQNAAEPQRLFSRSVDVDRLVAQAPIDWTDLADTARRARLTTPLWLTLRLAQSLLAVPVPDGTLAALRPSRIVRAHLRRLRPAAHATGARRMRAGELRLFQLWTLLGDHGLSTSLPWLYLHMFLGPRDRVRHAAKPAVRRWQGYAVDSARLLARHVVLYLPTTSRDGRTRRVDVGG